MQFASLFCFFFVSPLYYSLCHFFFTMKKLDIVQPISVILDRNNYQAWFQTIRSFLTGRELWCCIEGNIKLPTKSAEESDDAFACRLEAWDSKNHQVLTWFRNTSISSIHLQFSHFEMTKKVWDLLTSRFTISDLAHQHGCQKCELTITILRSYESKSLLRVRSCS